MNDRRKPEDEAPDDLFAWLGLNGTPDFGRARPLGALVGLVLLVPFVFAFATAFALLGSTLNGGNGNSGGNVDPTPDLYLSTRKRPRIDIQTAIDVIGRRSDRQTALEASERFRLDLHDTDLDGCTLMNGKFAGAILWRSRLEAADLTNCDLTGTQMQGSLLNFARFRDATLRGTNLDFATISEPKGGWHPHFPYGKVDGVTVVGAKLTAIDDLWTNASKIFGSKDTQLSSDMQREKDKFTGLRRDLHWARRGTDATEIRRLEAEIKQSPFVNWFVHGSNDWSLNGARKEFHARLGITGWPFED